MRDLSVALLERGARRASLVPRRLPSESADHEHQRLPRNFPPEKEPDVGEMKF